MGVKQLGHIVLYVRDMQASRAFYEGVLDWPAITGFSLGGTSATAFSLGHTHHDLLLIEVGPEASPIPAGRRVGMYHFGVKVGDSDDELRAMRDRLVEHGVHIVGTADHTITHSLYILDPDGNEIELYSDVAGVDWKSDPTAILAPIRALQL